MRSICCMSAVTFSNVKLPASTYRPTGQLADAFDVTDYTTPRVATIHGVGKQAQVRRRNAAWQAESKSRSVKTRHRLDTKVRSTFFFLLNSSHASVAAFTFVIYFLTFLSALRVTFVFNLYRL